MAATKAKKKAETKIETETKNEVQETKAEKTFTYEEVQELIKAALAEANKNQPVLQVVPEEMVTLLYAGRMAKGCVVSLGELGQINSDFGTIDVPKRAFLQKRNYIVDKLLEKRVILVIDGLTEDEKKRFNVDYDNGEVLTSDTLDELLGLPTKEIASIFDKLCEEHKRTVAKYFIEAYENKDNRVELGKIKKLNTLSKKVVPDGLFKPILAGLSKEITE